jgi:galactokinase
MYSMSSLDYEYNQERIAEAIKQYRGHTERDLDDLQLLREQTALQASLIWEQQMQICDMNKAYLELSDEKERVVLADNRLVHEGMEHITTMMTDLQQSLQKRHEVIAANMDRIDSPRITTTIQKLKSALQELQTRNAHLVMRNV